MKNARRKAWLRPRLWHIVIAGLLYSAVAASAEIHEFQQPNGDAGLFDNRRLLDIEIEIDEEDWSVIQSQTRAMALALRKPASPSPFRYYKADLTIDGYRIESVGIRKKGFVGSLDQRFPSLKVKFDKYLDQEPFAFIDRLTLNNNKQDRTLVSQAMAYQFYRDAGLPAPRCNLARVTVNGEYIGIYSNVESIRKPFLKRTFGNDDGKLYEGTLADFYVDRIDDLEAKSRKANDRQELKALAELLAREGDVPEEELATHLDVEEFLRFWCVESLLNTWDGYTGNQNNYFVYHDTDDRRFHFIPWGADATFLRFEFVKSKRESVHGASVLANKLYHTPQFAERYRVVLEEILDSVWNEERLLAELDRYEALVKPHLHRRQRGVHAALEETRNFVKTRRNEMEYDLERWPVRILKKPRKPAFTNSVGTVEGTFSAAWSDEAPEDKYGGGEAKLQMTLDGEPVEFTKLGVRLEKSEDDGGTRSIVFVGKRKSNGIRVTLRLGMSEKRFQTAHRGDPIGVQGNLEEGGFGLFGLFSPQGLRLVGGTITISEFGEETDERLAGSLNVDVLRFNQDR